MSLRFRSLNQGRECVAVLAYSGQSQITPVLLVSLLRELPTFSFRKLPVGDSDRVTLCKVGEPRGHPLQGFCGRVPSWGGDEGVLPPRGTLTIPDWENLV